ncbi:MAG: hypothetical protein KDA28_04975, partial [Phycisphaerales bacterium]|nr:hypothetical protein [Phycisphaerales bacterium]
MRRALLLCLATGTTTAVGQVIDWAAPLDGSWNAPANWNPADVPDLTTDEAILGLVGPYTVFSDVHSFIGRLSITNDEARLHLPSGRIFRVMSGLTNEGTILVNDTASIFNASLLVTSDATIDGTGSIVLNAGNETADAGVATEGDVWITHASGHTVRGGGQIRGQWINQGLFLGDASVMPLELNFATVDNTSGTLRADPGNMGYNGATLIGGVLESQNGGAHRVYGTDSTFDGVQNLGEIQILSGEVLGMRGSGLVNDGLIHVNSSQNIYNATLLFLEPCTLGGSGDILLDGATEAADANLTASAGITGTIGPDQTVRGNGQVVATATDAVIHNEGTIKGDVPGSGLVVRGTITQSGTMLADVGNVVLIGADVTGGMIDGQNGGRVYTQSEWCTFDGVTNLGDAGMAAGSVLSIVGDGFTNDGAFVVDFNGLIYNTTLRFDADATIGGSGVITLNGATEAADAQVLVASGFTGVNGAGHTIDGNGRIDALAGTLRNEGTILGNVPGGRMWLYGTIDQATGGLVRAAAGHVGLSGAQVTGGTIGGMGGGMIEIGGNPSIIDDLRIDGDVGVWGGADLAIGPAGVVNDGRLVISSDGTHYNAIVRANESTTITGSGSIELVSPTDIRDSHLYASPGAALFIGQQQTVRGTGWLDGDLRMQGTLAPGFSVGRLDLDGTLTMAPTSLYDVEMASATSYDRITGDGAVVLEGDMRLTPIDGYAPQWGDTFEVIRATTVTGEFDEVSAPPLAGNLVYRVLYSSDHVDVVVTCPPDVTEPYGEIDIFDVIRYLELFEAQDPDADLASPLGVFDIFDLIT